MNPVEKKYHAIAANEIDHGKIDPALRIASISKAKGDKEKAMAFYIKMRVSEIRNDELAEKRRIDALFKIRVEQKAHEEVLMAKKKADEFYAKEARYKAAYEKRESECPECKYIGAMRRAFIPPRNHRFGASAVICPKCDKRFDWTPIFDPNI